jgi:hypothetical protein
MPRLLEPFSFLQGYPRSRCDVVCSITAGFVFLVQASGGWHGACGFVCVRFWAWVSLSALALPPVSRVAARCSLQLRLARGAEAKAPLGWGVVPCLAFFTVLLLMHAMVSWSPCLRLVAFLFWYQKACSSHRQSSHNRVNNFRPGLFEQDFHLIR